MHDDKDAGEDWCNIMHPIGMMNWLWTWEGKVLVVATQLELLD